MLQLQTSRCCLLGRNGIGCLPCKCPHAAVPRPVVLLAGRKSNANASKLNAFRDNEFPSTSGTTTAPTSAPTIPPAPTTEVQNLVVYTTDGVKHNIPITPGITTVAHIRAEVAEKTNTAAEEVRLAYAGRELQPSLDFQAFTVKPGIDVMHAMGRLRGGGATGPDSNTELGVDDLLADDDTTAAAIAAAAAVLNARTSRTRRRTAANPGGHSSSSSSSSSSGGGGSSVRMQATIISETLGMAEDDTWPDNRVTRLRGMGLAAAAEVAHSRRRADVNRVPGARPGGNAQVQLARQFRDLMKNPIPGISAAPEDDDIYRWNVRLAGPEGTPYAGGWFDVRLKFTDGFPGSQPYIKFITPIWHPNVAQHHGNVCLDMTNGRGLGGVCTVACILSAVQMLLSSPNAANPLNSEAAAQMRRDPEEFERQARQMTRVYAM